MVNEYSSSAVVGETSDWVTWAGGMNAEPSYASANDGACPSSGNWSEYIVCRS